MTSDGGSLDTGSAMKFVNDECSGQCSCSAADFPTPAPPAPTPPPTPYPPGMKPPRADQYFILLGDWGATEWTRTNWRSKAGNAQTRVADRMKQYVRDNSKKLAFIASLGDNFYEGVGGDGQEWQESWKNFYDELTDVPWYATLGNHDFNKQDLKLGFGGGKGNQLNDGKSVRSNFYLPDYNYHVERPELKLEIISVDQNHASKHDRRTCQWAGHFQEGSCDWRHLEAKQTEGEELIKQRAIASRDDTTYLIIQHYPKSNGRVQKIWQENNGKGHLISAFGHDHDCNEGGTSISNGGILSGGGGGYGGKYCFVVVHLNDDETVRLETIRVD